MPIGEFELIARYFQQPRPPLATPRDDVVLGIGDDAALLKVPAGHELVAAIDTMVEGRHFPAGAPADSTGHRALAVNLSDLAAMGADPAWFLLALTLPRVDEAFLEAFARGLFTLAREHGIALVGGDTTSGPLTMSVQVLGTVPSGQALRRGGAAPGDLLYVSGTPGDAAAGLALLQAHRPEADDAHRRCLLQRFLFPEPRVELGRQLRGVASACIDVSDGLAGDAGRLAAASGCAVIIDAGLLPLSGALVAQGGAAAAVSCALRGGDDYELCFTVPPSRRGEFEARMANVKCRVTRIGIIAAGSGVRIERNGVPVDADTRGYDHFAAG
ncbi:MAG TPA: thiamine-phosphate kinase [Steroidobacteraceae bacterium]|nr:thiamine-phosphate kinase [Steroidobacteraceae bacterium]